MSTLPNKLHGILSPHGEVAVFNAKGAQVPELQVHFLRLWAQRARDMGHDPVGVVFGTSRGKIRITNFSKEDFSWETLP